MLRDNELYNQLSNLNVKTVELRKNKKYVFFSNNNLEIDEFEQKASCFTVLIAKFDAEMPILAISYMFISLKKSWIVCNILAISGSFFKLESAKPHIFSCNL